MTPEEQKDAFVCELVALCLRYNVSIDSEVNWALGDEVKGSEYSFQSKEWIATQDNVEDVFQLAQRIGL